MEIATATSFGNPGIDGYLYRSAASRRLAAMLTEGYHSKSGDPYPASEGRHGQVIFVFAAAPLAELPVPGGIGDGDCYLRFPISALPANARYLPSHIGGVIFCPQPFVIPGSVLELVPAEATARLQAVPRSAPLADPYEHLPAVI
jgi:hypothetical protein